MRVNLPTSFEKLLIFQAVPLIYNTAKLQTKGTSIENDLVGDIDISSIVNEFALKNRVSTTFTKPLQNEKDKLHYYILSVKVQLFLFLIG